MNQLLLTGPAVSGSSSAPDTPRPAIPRSRAAWLAAVLGLGLAACGGLGGSSDGTATIHQAQSNNSPQCQQQAATDRLTALEGLTNGVQIKCANGGNSDCPCGSFCNDFAVCQTECAPDDLQAPASDNLTCGSSQVCSPDGHCLNGPNDTGPQPQLTLHISQPAIVANTMNGPVTITVDVSVDANTLAFVVGNHPGTVGYQLLPTDPDDTSPLPSVQCSPDDLEVPHCEIDGGWQFDVSAHSLHSQPKQIIITIPQSAAPKSWILRAGSEWAADPTTSVVRAAPVTIPATDPGHYFGTLAWHPPGTSDDDVAISVPIEALVTTSTVALIEPTQTVLPDGHAVFDRTGTDTTLLGWLGSTDASGNPALYDVRVDAITQHYDPTTGTLTGKLNVYPDAAAPAASGTFTLVRTGDITVPACAHASDCATGSYCETAIGFCLAGSGPATGPGLVPASTVSSASLPSSLVNAWASAVTSMQSANQTLLSTSSGGAYCFQAASQGQPATLLPAGSSLASPSDDLSCQLQALGGGTPPPPYNQMTFPLYNVQSDSGPDNGGDALTLLQQCLSELAAAPTGDITSDMAPNPHCVSLGRFFTAMSGATGGDTAVRLKTQILRQWAGLHAYVANTTVQDQAFDDALNTSTATAATRFGTVVDRLQQDLMVFLHQTVKQSYLGGTVWPLVAVKPDYRVQQRPVVRWTFNGGASPFADAEGSNNSFTASNVTLSGGTILQTGSGGTCQSSLPVDLSDGLGNNNFSVGFFLNGPIFGTTTVFQKTAPGGDRFWIDVAGDTSSPQHLTFTAHDSSGRGSTFPAVTSPSTNPAQSLFPGLVFFSASGGPTGTQGTTLETYTPAGHTFGPGLPISGSGHPRWGAPGTVSLQCNLTETPTYNTCTSYDLNTAGDNLDPTYSTQHEQAWTMTEVCTSKGVCSGSAGSSAACNASASARLSQLNQQLMSSVPAPILANLKVTGSYRRTGTLTVTGTCNLEIDFLPSPTTRAKPVCGLASGDIVAPAGITYDELSLWNRPLIAQETAALAAAYGFTPTSQSLPPAATAPLPSAEQSHGLAPALLEAASAHINLLAAYLDASRGTIYTECFQGGPSPTLSTVQAKVGPGLRLALLLQSQAAQLAAVDGASSAAWFSRYQADQHDLAGKYQRLLALLQSAQACNNPLHISENEIPLYIGDASGLSANDRFFAGTKALIGLLENAHGELTTAAGELQSARQAYISQQQSEFQETAVAQANADRVDGINGLRAQYESQLRKYCGAPSSDIPPDETGAGGSNSQSLLDGFLTGALTADNCFLATDVPGCANAATLLTGDVPAACLRGDMGARVIAIQTAAVDIQTARLAVDRSVDQWNADELNCITRNGILDDVTALQINHQQRLVTLRQQQASGDNAAGELSTVIDVGVIVVAAAVTGGTGAAILAGVAAGAGAGQSILANADKAYSDDIGVQQAQEEQDYQDHLALLTEEADLADCFHKADNDEFAVDAAIAATGRTLKEADAAGQALADARSQVAAIAQEAQGQINRENTIDRTPPHLHYWLDDDITSYTSHMKNARRLTYLAVRTFEYEAQVSSNQRAAVMTARTPTDLQNVLDTLTAASASFAGQLPNAGSPGQTPDVFSLRDDILDLGGLIAAENPPGQPPPLSKEQAFTTLLTSDSSQLFDGSGNLLGHAIRFTLSGNSPWNQDTCAERIWRITPSVSVTGGGPSGPNATHLVLYQSNTFGSQVCTDPAHPDVPAGAVSLVRYQPVSNLLTGDDPVTFASPDSLSSISIDYVTNLSQHDLQVAQQGDNPLGFASGFAGRGALGNYILLFPACTGCSDSQGWTDAQLANVTDVLLRIDVVSASNINNNTH